jgi:hypothetical protein
MPSSFTSSLKFELMQAGDFVNTWGDPKLNGVLQNIETAIVGVRIIALTGDYTLTGSNLGANDARYAILKFTGAGPYVITVPSASNVFKIWNACSAALTFTTGAGATVAVDPGDIVEVFCDGSNVETLGYGGVSLKAYIASVVVGGGATVPSLVGNAGKFLTNNGSIASWANPTVSDISNYASDQATKTAAATALAVAFAVSL